jgi:hypothetical protein
LLLANAITSPTAGGYEAGAGAGGELATLARAPGAAGELSLARAPGVRGEPALTPPTTAQQDEVNRAEEIMKYSRHLGINPVFEPDLLWIAEQALGGASFIALAPSCTACATLVY